MKRILLITIAGLLLAGCATPIGQWKKSDLYWNEKIITARYDEAYARLLDGFRKDDDYAWEGTLYAEKKTGHFDIYVRNVLNLGKSSVGLATIDIIQLEDGNTKVLIGCRNSRWADWCGKRWIKFAEGDYSSLDDPQPTQSDK